MKIYLGAVLLLIPSLILAACSPGRSPAAQISTPGAAAQSSPALPSTPTLSPTPSATPAPLPTASPTLQPTNTPTPPPHLDFETNLTLQDLVEFFYQTGDYELLVSLLGELAGYYKTPATIGRVYALQGDAYARSGDYESAATAFIKALEVFPQVQQVNGDLCRVYGLMEKADQALPYCEKAAKANPTYKTFIYRGKIYASLGKFDPAVQDFQMAAKLLERSTGAEEIKVYQALTDWIEALKAGKNPITPQILAEDRQLEMASAMPTQTIEEKAVPSSKMVQEAAAKFGFNEFKPSDLKDPFQENGLPFLAASLKLDPCSVDLALQAKDDLVSKIMVTMKGCSYLEEYFISLRLIDEFFRSKTEKAEALVWLFKEANSVIEVQNAEAKKANLQKCNLSASYRRTDKSTVLLFSCH